MFKYFILIIFFTNNALATYSLRHLYFPNKQNQFQDEVVKTESEVIINQRKFIIAYYNQAETLQEKLLKEGKAVLYPDANISLADFQKFQTAEDEAISNKIGIWQSEIMYFNKDSIKNYNLENKFIVYEGIVDNIYYNKQYVILSLDNKLIYIDIPKEVWVKILKKNKKSYILNKKVIAKGWVVSARISRLEIVNEFLIRFLR